MTLYVIEVDDLNIKMLSYRRWKDYGCLTISVESQLLQYGYSSIGLKNSYIIDIDRPHPTNQDLQDTIDKITYDINHKRMMKEYINKL